MKSLQQWLSEYGESHRNPINKSLHWVCVPLIVFSLVGMLRVVPAGHGYLNAATIVGVLALAYYALLSWRLALGMLPLFLIMYALATWSYHGLAGMHIPLMVGIFVLSWIGQFIGHRVERKKPSFFKDVQFLLIGPLWLLAALYRRLNLGGAELAEPRGAS